MNTSSEMNLMEIQETIQDLQSKLLSAHPEMPILLRKIHTKLKADPDIVTLLTEEEIAVIIAGLKEQTNVQFATSAKKPAAKKSTAAGRLSSILKSSGVTADDF